MISWSERVKQGGRLSTREIVRSQMLSQGLNPERALQKAVAQGKLDSSGRPRQFAFCLEDDYQVFLNHPTLPLRLRELDGLKIGAHDVTEGQKLAITLLAYGPAMGVRPRGSVSIDGAAFRRSGPAKENDGEMIRVTAGTPEGGSGLTLIDFLTGSGKTFMSMVAALKLAERATTTFALERQRANTRAHGGVRFLIEDPAKATLLCPCAVFQIGSPPLQQHYEQQLALVLPTLRLGRRVEIWTNKPDPKLVDAVARLPGVSLGQTGKMTLGTLRQYAGRDDVVVVWFQGLRDNAAKTQRMQPSRKRTFDEVESGVLAADMFVPVLVADELMDPGSTRWPNQGLRSLTYWVTQATPSELVKVRLSHEHWLRAAVPATLHALTQGHHLTPRDAEEAMTGLLRMSMAAIPQRLREKVADEVVARMPLGLEIMPIGCAQPFLAGPLAGQDGVSPVALRTLLGFLANHSYSVPLAVRQRLLDSMGADVSLACLRTELLEFRRHTHNPALDETIERAGAVSCVECGASQLVVRPCCTGLLCRNCAVGACLLCRTGQSPATPATPARPARPATSGQPCPPTLDELRFRTIRQTTPLRTLEQVIGALVTGDLGRRILLFCGSTHVLDKLDAPIERGCLGDKVRDREVLTKYCDRADTNPMLLYCRNSLATVAGHDLAITTAVVVIGKLANPAQLVARVLRAGDPNCQRHVPIIVIS